LFCSSSWVIIHDIWARWQFSLSIVLSVECHGRCLWCTGRLSRRDYIKNLHRILDSASSDGCYLGSFYYWVLVLYVLVIVVKKKTHFVVFVGFWLFTWCCHDAHQYSCHNCSARWQLRKSGRINRWSTIWICHFCSTPSKQITSDCFVDHNFCWVISLSHYYWNNRIKSKGLHLFT
jgi:hypothetical protein